MAKFDGITIDINAKLNVDRNTANGCLKLLEIYMNDHRDLYLDITRLEDGTDAYTIVRRCGHVGTQQPNTETDGA